MKKTFNQLFSDRLILQATTLTFIFLLLSVVAIAITWQYLPPIVPLYNQASWGDPRLADKIFLFLPSLIVLTGVIVNSIIARFYLNSMPLIARFLAITITFSSILVFIFDIRTLQLII